MPFGRLQTKIQRPPSRISRTGYKFMVIGEICPDTGRAACAREETRAEIAPSAERDGRKFVTFYCRPCTEKFMANFKNRKILKFSYIYNNIMAAILSNSNVSNSIIVTQCFKTCKFGLFQQNLYTLIISKNIW